MRYAFAILLSVHGLIHIMGFVRAFYLTDLNKQISGLSKPIGALWLVAFLLFIISATQFFQNKKWFYIACLAVLLSQILIVLEWTSAKFGTLPNVIILLIAIGAYSTYAFHLKADTVSKTLLESNQTVTTSTILERDIKHLPEPVQHWLTRSGVIGNGIISSVRLQQKGSMRTKPDGKWMPFDAQQYFDVTNASFVWTTQVQAMPVIPMMGCDKLINGEGAMLIKVGGLLPVVNERENDKINSGAMIRYLSEMCWFPTAALKDYIHWEPIDETSAKAIFTYANQSVSGVFTFTSEGDIKTFKALRYKDTSDNAKPENWCVEMLSCASFNGIRIPNNSKVTWQLEGGDFHWLTAEITALDYNPIQLY